MKEPKKFKLVSDGGGFSKELSYHSTLALAEKRALESFELRFQTRHKRGIILERKDGESPWIKVKELNYKPEPKKDPSDG